MRLPAVLESGGQTQRRILPQLLDPAEEDLAWSARKLIVEHYTIEHGSRSSTRTSLDGVPILTLLVTAPAVIFTHRCLAHARARAGDGQ
jgi:hypothetical protein